MAAKKRARGKPSSSKKKAKVAARKPSKKVELTRSQKSLVNKLAERDREIEALRKKLEEAEGREAKRALKKKEKAAKEQRQEVAKKAATSVQKLEKKAEREKETVERKERTLDQAKAIKQALTGKKVKKPKKAAKPRPSSIFRPEDERPERPEIQPAGPSGKTRRKPRVKLEGETIAERMKRADEMIEMLRDQKRKLRDDLRKLEKTPGTSAEKKALSEEAAQKIRDFLDNVKEELLLHGRESSFRVVANRDATVDAELRVPIMLGTSVDEVRDLMIVLEETIGNGIPETQWVSVGFTADPSVNEEGVLRSAREYVAHEGQVRFNTSYQEASQKMIGYSFLIGEKALSGFVNAYGPKITGVLVRIAWSLSGRLFRLNDTDLRKPRKKRAPKR